MKPGLAATFDLVDWLKSSLERLPQSASMRAVREGLLWLLPTLLVSAACLMMASLLGISSRWAGFVTSLYAIHQGINELIPLMVAASIGNMLAFKHRLPHMSVAFLCLAYVAIAKSLLGAHSQGALAYILLIALSTPLVTVPIIDLLYRQRWTQLVRAEIAGDNVKNVLNLVIPGVIVGLGIAGGMGFLLGLPVLDRLDIGLGVDTEYIAHSPYLSGMIYSALNSVLWFFGIHGANALLPLEDVFKAALDLDQMALKDGGAAHYLMNSSFLAVFVFIGGCGATLSLVLAILVVCKNKTLRLLALASIPIAMLNVNEILLFGLPIILNARLLMPFMLVPLMNVSVGLTAIKAGLVGPVTVAVPLTSPVGMNAYIATYGDIHAVILQAVLVLIGALIYIPFIRRIDQRASQTSEIHVKSLKAVYRQLNEEAAVFGFDPVGTVNQIRMQQFLNRKHLEELSEVEFFLEYQPQICGHTGRFTGCEALLRCRGPDGKVRYPGQFIAWLEQAKMLKELDLWVAETAATQYRLWSEMGLEISVTINVTVDTLSSATAMDELVNVLRPAGGRISIEITEQAMAADQATVQSAIDKIHSICAKVYIDDFGTGYSAIGYLHQFRIDVIKIDQSFVRALNVEQGRKVMHGVLRFAETLQIPCVVEGVETNEELGEVCNGHAVTIQGWLFSKSLGGAHIPEFVRRMESANAEHCLTA